MNAEPPPLPKAPVHLSATRKVIMILAYVIAGFFVYMGCFLAFIRIPDPKFKYIFVLIVFGTSLVALLAGLITSKFSRVARHAGLVLASASMFTGIIVLMLIGWMHNPIYRHLFEQRTVVTFNDYAVGGGVTCVVLLFGAVLLLFSWRRPRAAVVPRG